MENPIAFFVTALLLALAIRAILPPRRPAQVIYVQSEDDLSLASSRRGSGCFGTIVLVVLLLVALRIALAVWI